MREALPKGERAIIPASVRAREGPGIPLPLTRRPDIMLGEYASLKWSRGRVMRARETGLLTRFDRCSHRAGRSGRSPSPPRSNSYTPRSTPSPDRARSLSGEQRRHRRASDVRSRARDPLARREDREGVTGARLPSASRNGNVDSMPLLGTRTGGRKWVAVLPPLMRAANAWLLRDRSIAGFLPRAALRRLVLPAGCGHHFVNRIELADHRTAWGSSDPMMAAPEFRAARSDSASRCREEASHLLPLADYAPTRDFADAPPVVMQLRADRHAAGVATRHPKKEERGGLPSPVPARRRQFSRTRTLPRCQDEGVRSMARLQAPRFISRVVQTMARSSRAQGLDLRLAARGPTPPFFPRRAATARDLTAPVPVIRKQSALRAPTTGSARGYGASVVHSEPRARRSQDCVWSRCEGTRRSMKVFFRAKRSSDAG